MLEFASRADAVNGIVFTLSIVALATFNKLAIHGAGDEIFDDEAKTSFDEGPYKIEFQTYSAAKTIAYNSALECMEKLNPSFDIVHPKSSLIRGRDDLQTTLKSMLNAIIMSLAPGKQRDAPRPCLSVHNDDVARAHVQALDPKIPAGTYNLSRSNGESIDWTAVPSLVERLFPAAVKDGMLNPQKAKAMTVAIRMTSAKGTTTFGFEFSAIEKQVKRVVCQYLGFLNEEQSD